MSYERETKYQIGKNVSNALRFTQLFFSTCGNRKTKNKLGAVLEVLEPLGSLNQLVSSPKERLQRG